MQTIDFQLNANVRRNENIERLRIEMAKYKPLSDNELRPLIEAAQSGSLAALDTITKTNLRILWSISASYNGLLEFEDIFQEASIGLINAVKTFDLQRDNAFTTWLLEHVRKAITEAITNKSRTVRMGAHLVRAKNSYISVSMDAPLSADGEDDKKCYIDTFKSYERADNLTDINDLKVRIEFLLKGLKPKEKRVICGLFGFGCPEVSAYTLSKELNYTEERIRQIKFEALEKMRRFGLGK